MKTIIQAMRTLPPLALNAEPARCATGSPGKHTHREFPGEWANGWGYLSCHRKVHTGTPPLAPVPRSLQKADEGLSQVEDSFLNFKSCSQTLCEARGQGAPYLPRAMRGVETRGENP